MTTPTVRFEIDNAISWVTMSNPARRNALSTTMMQQLEQSLRNLDVDPAVRAIILRGEGTAAFASGLDISEFDAQQNSQKAKHRADEITDKLFNTLAAMTKPVIAMIFGPCLGAGVAIASYADIRLCAATSQFAIPAARLGLGYPVELIHALVRIAGPGQAAELLFTGRTFSAAEALQAGIVNSIFAPEALEEATRGLAGTIAGNAPLSVRAAKAAIRSHGAPEYRATAEELAMACARSADVREGQRAFMQKRKPQFVGS
ncbi:enoyl-CoA hydratase-related protein [Mycobacterium sp. 1465703.0]|uniref:enoyl-CoA hydratase-related protein n=1 Tax=Mycobacterium sp. 1465703.0 TaxID=1834078 RepID=UPI0007FC6598|nr:enoyl-CoA hydratase-related protein [Mycobacterium sp. 1465703.0]OBJ08845.1 hypothetical protein A5625_14155 [Mycobacterium sp. 1465703.0]